MKRGTLGRLWSESMVIGVVIAVLLAWGSPAFADDAERPGHPDYLPFCHCERPGVPDDTSPNTVKAGGSVWDQLLARLGAVFAVRISVRPT